MTNFYLLFKYNILISIFVFISFLVLNENYSLFTFGMTLLATISSVIVVYTVFFIILFIFLMFGKIGLYFSAFFYILFDSLLILDFINFSQNNTHLDLLNLDLLLNLNIIENLNLDIFTLLFVSFIIVLLIFIEIYLISGICKLNKFQLKRENSSFNKFIIVPFVLLVLVDKVSYTYLNLNNDETIFYYKVIPFYPEVDVHKIIDNYKQIKQEFNL